MKIGRAAKIVMWAVAVVLIGTAALHLELPFESDHRFAMYEFDGGYFALRPTMKGETLADAAQYETGDVLMTSPGNQRGFDGSKPGWLVGSDEWWGRFGGVGSGQLVSLFEEEAWKAKVEVGPKGVQVSGRSSLDGIRFSSRPVCSRSQCTVVDSQASGRMHWLDWIGGV